MKAASEGVGLGSSNPFRTREALASTIAVVLVTATVFASSFYQITQEEARERRRDLVRGILIVGGALLVLFGLAFTAHVLLEYVIGPLIRFFA